jgi:5-hydroxyisourate hydrolase-like protein (transthyretin family)
LLRYRDKRSRLAAGIVVCTVLFLLAINPGSSAQQANQSGRISGKVVDALSGAPLTRCSVEIDPTEDRGTSRSMETGDDGLFAFDGVAEGKYRLSASKRGYLPQAYEQHDNFSTAIVVGTGLQSEGLIFKVVPQAIITGVVTDERGDPVRRAEVRLFKDEDRAGIRSTVQRQTAMTDDRGVYELARIDPGNYYLAVGHPWYAQTVSPGQPNEKGAEEPASPLDVAYPTTFYPRATDSEDATPIPIRGGERLQADVTLNAQQAFHIRIPLPAKDQEGGFSLMASQSIFGHAETVSPFGVTIQNGVMESVGILPGHYDFTLEHHGPGGATTESTHFSGDVTSSSAELTPVDEESEVTVTGKVTSVDGKVPSGGIALLPAHQGRSHPAMLDKGGEFSVKVPPGDYEILGQIPQMYLARLASQDGVLKNRVLTVRAGSSPKLDLLASKGFGQVDGVVKRGDQPASGVMVLLAPADNPFLFRRDQSDSDGTFTLGMVVPGRYRLLAVERGWELEWANRDVLNAFLKKSVPVEVRANDKLTRMVEVQSR